MDSNASALHSEYIIDGVRQELTPAEIMDACMSHPSPAPKWGYPSVVDETLDPSVKACDTDPGKLFDYLQDIKALAASSASEPDIPFPENYAKSLVAGSLIDAIWRKGHFALCNLALSLEWKWRTSKLGAMADFYSAVSAAADYIDSLGIRISSYSFKEAVRGDGSLVVKTSIEPSVGLEDELDDDDVRISTQNAIAKTFKPDPKSWIIYIPFEHCQYKLGGSLLARSLGVTGSMPPQLVDADYFIDCYELVRELVEDHIALSGATVSRGGLISALSGMTSQGVGASIDLGEFAKAAGEKDIVRLLFAEVPGVVVQVADIDYDYIDAEMLLQDVAYYPLGHPVCGSSELEIQSSDKTGIQTILESIIRSQNEGED